MLAAIPLDTATPADSLFRGLLVWPAVSLMSLSSTNPAQEAASDLGLIAAVAQGDDGALRRLMDRHLARVAGLAQRILGSPDEADEVAQEVFVRVWRKAGSFDASGRRAKFTTWLYKITFNCCLDRKRRVHGEWAAVDEDLADSAPGPATTEEQRQLRQLLAQGLARLPERQRAALVLHYLEELSAREAGIVMGLGEKGFESLVLRARRALREQLQTHISAEDWQ